MPAHPVLDDLKAVQFNLDGETREHLIELVRAEKSSNSAVVRRLIDQAYRALVRSRLHSSEDFTHTAPTAPIEA